VSISEVWNVIRRQWIAVTIVFVIGLLVIVRYEITAKDSYTGTAHVLLVTQPGSHDSTVSISDLPTVATSTIVLERVRHALNLPITLMQLKSHVSAKVVARSSIMEITYRDPSEALAIGIPNAVADNLSQYFSEISADSYTRNVTNLTEALAQQGNKIAELNKRLAHAVRSEPFVITEKSADDVTERLDSLETQRALAEAEATGNAAIADTTAPSAGLSKLARHEILEGDRRYKALSESSARDFAQLSTDRAGYTENFPGLAGEEEKVDREQSALDGESQRALEDPDRFSPSEAATQASHERQLAILTGAQSRVAKLDELIAQEKARLTDLPGTGLMVATLRAQRDDAQLDYNALSSRRAAALANRAEAFTLGSIQVLDRAISAGTTIGSNRPIIAFVMTLLLCAVATGIAYLIDAIDPRIRRAAQVEAMYGRPVIADIGSRVA